MLFLPFLHWPVGGAALSLHRWVKQPGVNRKICASEGRTRKGHRCSVCDMIVRYRTRIEECRNSIIICLLTGSDVYDVQYRLQLQITLIFSVSICSQLCVGMGLCHDWLLRCVICYEAHTWYKYDRRTQTLIWKIQRYHGRRIHFYIWKWSMMCMWREDRGTCCCVGFPLSSVRHNVMLIDYSTEPEVCVQLRRRAA